MRISGLFNGNMASFYYASMRSWPIYLNKVKYMNQNVKSEYFLWKKNAISFGIFQMIT